MNTASAVTVGDTRSRNLTIVAVAAVTALAMVIFMISSVTSAAWTDTTRNDGNSWATGTVALTDDALEGAAMFQVTNMVPGQIEENSITVTNEGTVPLDVRLYGGNLVDSDPSLAAHLNVTIGTTDGGTDVFSGTLASFASTHTQFSDGTAAIGLAAANVGDTDDQQYWFSVELDDEAPDTVQGKTATIDFVWEGQTVAP